MSIPRSDATQTVLRRGRFELDIKVLVVGGSNSSTDFLDSAELFTSGEVNV